MAKYVITGMKNIVINLKKEFGPIGRLHTLSQFADKYSVCESEDDTDTTVEIFLKEIAKVFRFSDIEEAEIDKRMKEIEDSIKVEYFFKKNYEGTH